jgi:2-polyprenyl-3-methyl-5-hydroxy-6-metoxy-1,4-benzoquinol methylase
LDHWDNGFLRLLGISEEEGRILVARSLSRSISTLGIHFSGLGLESKVRSLRGSFRSFFHLNSIPEGDQSRFLGSIGPCGHGATVLLERRIADTPDYAVVGCSECQLGWLVDIANPVVRPTSTVGYNYEYFEGGQHGLGYGDYLAQQWWRLEKAQRYLRQIEAVALSEGISFDLIGKYALDIGSGYGFFRKALEDGGWMHDGLEVSRHAVEMSRNLFGFDTYYARVEELSNEFAEKYSLVTLWDCIEHVSFPDKFLASATKFLRPGGILALRTPNLNALEREILGWRYYSLRREHLVYFTSKSLLNLALGVGVCPRMLTTECHFFKGFLGKDMEAQAKLLQGSDLLLICRKGG